MFEERLIAVGLIPFGFRRRPLRSVSSGVDAGLPCPRRWIYKCEVGEEQASIWRSDNHAAPKCLLLPAMRVGRAPDCHLALREGYVSHDHASFRHAGSGEWLLRDLGSRNGTFVNGRRLAAGDVKLSNRDVIWFGDERASWLFSPGRPCDLIVVSEGRTEWAAVPSGGSLLAIPSDEIPVGTLLRRGSDWQLEAPGVDPAVLRDGQTFVVSGVQYRAWISNAGDPTHDAVLGRRRLNDTVLRLAVSRDEEQVEGELQLDEGKVALPSRVYLYLLVVLGRYRLEDAQRGVDIGETGWRYVDDVSRSIGIDQQTLNVQIHRARRDVAKLGFQDPGLLIERRTMTKQLRIGIPPERVVLSNI